jgi:acetolactate synthase regulatory subunit
MNLPTFAELVRIMPEGYAQHCLEKELERVILLARHEGFVVTIEEKPKKDLAMGNTEMVPSVRRARGHY